MRRVRVKQLIKRRTFNGTYAFTLGKVGTVNEEKTAQYPSGFRFAVEFPDLKNDGSEYGLFYFLKEEVELVGDLQIDLAELEQLLY